ncbi:DUF6191 domain-containing protein [Kitasatospora sp. cg17-2]
MLSTVSLTGSLLFPAALVAAFFVLAAARQFVLRVQRPAWVLQRLQQRDDLGERGVGATATEELHALLYPGKRVQLEQRRIELVLRDDENDGAPRKPGSTSMPAPRPSIGSRPAAPACRSAGSSRTTPPGPASGRAGRVDPKCPMASASWEASLGVQP